MVENQIKASAIKHYKQGRVKYDLGQYAEAILDYNFAIALRPDYALIYYNRGRAKHDLGQYDAAIADYDIAIRLKPDYALAYYNLGNARAKLGHTWQAERSWQTALKLATQAGNVTLKNEIKSILPQSANQVKTSNSAEDTLSDISAEEQRRREMFDAGIQIARDHGIG